MRIFAIMIALMLVCSVCFAADGDTNFTNVVASGDITAGDDLSVGDDASVGGDLSVTGAATITGTMTVTGTMALSSAITPAAPINVGTYFQQCQDFVMTSITGASYEQIHGVILNADTNDFAVTAAAVGGVVSATTAASDNDGSQILLSVPVQASKGGLVFETRLFIGSSVENVCINAGLTDSTSLEMPAEISGTTITTNASDACVFVYDTDQTTDKWYVVGVKANTDATGNGITTSTPVADTYQTLRIEIPAAGTTASFYINGTLVGSLTANAITAATKVYATVNIESRDAGGAKAVSVDYIFLGHTR